MSCLVLGGTRGLGAAIARELAAEGELTIAVGSSAVDRSQGLLTHLRCDISWQKDREMLERLIALNPPTRFFWVAGRHMMGPLAHASLSQIEKTIAINFTAGALIATTVWQSMYCSDEPCSFAVVTSSSGVVPRANEVIYSATKFAQEGFVRSLAEENNNPNVRIAHFRPGAMRTGMWKSRAIPVGYTFLDANKVGHYIAGRVIGQTEPYWCEDIRRDRTEFLED